MSNVLRDLWNAGSITLWADYRGGTARDYSPLQRHGTVTAPVRFSRQGAHFAGVGRITHPDHALGRQTSGSVVFLSSFNNPYLGLPMDVRSLGHKRFSWYAWGVGHLAFEGMGVGAEPTVNALFGKRCLGVNYSNGAVTPFYINGVYSNTDIAQTIVVDNPPFTVGNSYAGGNPYASPIACVFETNRPLTASQHAQVYGELARTPWPGVPQRSLWAGCSLLDGRDPTLLASYDLVNSTGVCFDKTGTGNGAVTGTASDLGPGGMPALYFNGTSDKIITTTSYTSGARTFSFWAKSSLVTVNTAIFSHGASAVGSFRFNDTNLPMFYGGVGKSRSWVDTVAQDDGLWHHWLLTCTAGVEDSALYLDGVACTVSATVGTGFDAWGALNIGYTTAGSYFIGSISDLRVMNFAMTPAQIVEFRRKNYAQLNVAVTDWGVPVSDASRGGVAGQYLENTGWQFGSATPRYVVDVSTIEGRNVKALKCTTAGHLYLPTSVMGMTPAQAAYGEWRFSFVAWVAATSVPFLSIISNQNTVFSAAGTNGYFFRSVSGLAQLYLMTNGSATRKISGGVIAEKIWYSARITRTAAGLFTMWIKGGAYTAWTLVGSATDNTHTISNYMVIDNDAGDMVSLGDVCGNLGLTKAQL